MSAGTRCSTTSNSSSRGTPNASRPTAIDVHALHRGDRGQAARRQGLGERDRRDGRLHEPRGERAEQRGGDGQEHGERAREHDAPTSATPPPPGPPPSTPTNASSPAHETKDPGGTGREALMATRAPRGRSAARSDGRRTEPSRARRAPAPSGRCMYYIRQLPQYLRLLGGLDHRSARVDGRQAARRRRDRVHRDADRPHSRLHSVLRRDRRRVHPRARAAAAGRRMPGASCCSTLDAAIRATSPT